MSQFETALTTYRSFTDHFQSIVIGTVSEDGIPNASYAPFVMDENKNIYLYVSGLATHTENLHTVPKVSVLFIEDESQTQQIFARNRLTFDCTATLVERNTVFWSQIVELFEARFGEIIQLFRDLPDFRIFQLTPSKGRFVMGFGAAYNVDPNDFNSLVHVTSSDRRPQ